MRGHGGVYQVVDYIPTLLRDQVHSASAFMDYNVTAPPGFFLPQFCSINTGARQEKRIYTAHRDRRSTSRNQAIKKLATLRLVQKMLMVSAARKVCTIKVQRSSC